MINTGKSRLLGANLDLSFLATESDLLTAQAEFLNTKFRQFVYAAAAT